MEEQYFNRIVQEYSDMVYRIAYSYCKNKEDAEDIYQNVFLKLFDYSKKFISDEHVKRWLIRVTVNVIKTEPNAYRNLSRINSFIICFR